MSDTTHAIINAAGRQLTIRGSVQSYLDYHQGWDAEKSAFMNSARHVPQGSTVIDVGANVGILSCSLAAVRPDLQIIAIEPVPENFAYLMENVLENGLQNIRCINAAASDKPGRLRFNVNGPCSTVRPDGEVGVDTMMLDDLVNEQVSFVKIDVEGWEPHVIAGGQSLFHEHKPKIFMEWNTWGLLVANQNPLDFASSIWNDFEVIDVFHAEQSFGPPTDFLAIPHDNITRFSSVSDLLMVPRG